MKKIICLGLFFLFSLQNIGAMPINKMANNFNSFELKLRDICTFEENGVKVEYKTKSSKEEELINLKTKIDNMYKNKKILLTDDDIKVDTGISTIIINIYSEESFCKVDISLINRKAEKNILNLMKELTKLQSINSTEAQYFKYLKGRISNIKGTIEELKSTKELKDIHTLEIHNGYVGIANFYNGERVNFTVSSYDTGYYLIIGTPIIFTTY